MQQLRMAEDEEAAGLSRVHMHESKYNLPLQDTYATRRLHVELLLIKVHFITTTRPISILLDT